MGVGIAIGLGVASLASGIYGADKARKAANQGRDAIMNAPNRAMDYTDKLLSRYGRPEYGDANFYATGPEGYKAKGRAVFDSQMGFANPVLADEKRAIEQRMLAQGMPSSLITEALRAVEEKYAMATQQASFMGTMVGVDMQTQEDVRRTAFEQAESAKLFNETAYGSSLAANLVGSMTGGATAAAQVGQVGVQQVGDFAAGAGTGLGGLYQNYQNYSLGQQYVDAMSGGNIQQGLPGADFDEANYTPFR